MQGKSGYGRGTYRELATRGIFAFCVLKPRTDVMLFLFLDRRQHDLLSSDVAIDADLLTRAVCSTPIHFPLVISSMTRDPSPHDYPFLSPPCKHHPALFDTVALLSFCQSIFACFSFSLHWLYFLLAIYESFFMTCLSHRPRCLDGDPPQCIVGVVIRVILLFVVPLPSMPVLVQPDDESYLI
jgi:hypothetical protein